MRRICFLFSLWLCSLWMFAQQQQYKGRIVDAETGEPMAYATMYVSPGHGALTNIDGQFTLLAQPTDNVRISFVGYVTQEIKASALKGILKMQPLARSLNEVTVLGTDAILMRVKDNLRHDFSKNQHRKAHYFCRMTFLKDQQTEMVEAFLEAKSAVNLRGLCVTNGQYWAKAPEGRVQSELRNTNFHVNYTLGPMIRGNEVWKDILIVPFPEEGGSAYIRSNYEMSQTTLSGTRDRTIYAITLTPKDKKYIRPMLGGTLYVDAETYHLLRFDGFIYNVNATATYGDKKERTRLDIAIKIDYQRKNGYTEVADISCSAINEDVEFHTVLTNVEEYNLPFTYGEQIDRNLLTAIERAGSNPEVEGKYVFVERTDRELAVTQESGDAPVDMVTQRQLDEGEKLLPQLEQITDTAGVLSYIRKAMNFSQAYPQEKVYLHLDNTGYFKGETIWFKAYVTRTDTETRTDLSKILYVELLNPSGDVVERRKLPIQNGEAYGDIKVDSIMTTGFYELRAFTRVMTNWGTQACYSRMLPIFRAPKQAGDYDNPTIDRLSYRHRLNNERQTSAEASNANIVSLEESAGASGEKTKSARSFSLHFYPEGGSLVEGLPARVAFSAMGKEGEPITVSGYVQDAEGNHVADLLTLRDGRGLFSLSSVGRDFKVVAKDASGSEKTFPLPTVQSSGCALTVDAVREERLSVDVYSTADVVGSKVGYVMMHGGKIVRCDTLTAKPHVQFFFHRDYLPRGVNQLSFFDAEGRILAERLFFVIPQGAATDSIMVTSPNEYLSPCGRVTFNLQAQPNATLSFAAVDAAGMVNGNYGNMRTWLLLGSEVRGYIHHPEYYLEADDEEHRRAADLLMLVQGWRRYDWQLMSGKSTFAKFQPVEDRLLLYGMVKAGKKKLDVSGVDVTAFFYNAQGQSFNATTTTTELGQYGFALPDISGEWTLQLKAKKNDVPESYVVGIDRNFSPAARYVSEQEAQTIPVDDERAFRWTISEEDTAKWVSITKKDILLKTAQVKAKRRVWDRTGWNDETNARHFSMIYYNCDEDADRIADEGEPDPGFCEWLKGKNNLFDGEAATRNVLIAKPITPNQEEFRKSGRNTHTVFDLDDYLALFQGDYEAPGWRMDPPTRFLRFFGDGLLYKRRPIVWVVDNQFCTITNFHLRRDAELSRSMENLTAMFASVMHTDNPANTNIDLPVWLEDVKSVYISENIEGLHDHLYVDEVDDMNPVVIYCYTHRRFLEKEKGVRYTHYQGFNMPSTFQMEDYSVVPPMEDFRRTLYWAPNVKLDRRGKGTVEFYNNSSCTEMFISAEGMTTDGKPLTAY